MSPPAHNPVPIRKPRRQVLTTLLVLVPTLLLCCSWSPATAQCLDYRNYLRWTGGLYTAPAEAACVAVSDGMACLTLGADGIRMIYISDPANPQLLGSVGTSGRAGDVEISGSYAFVDIGDSGLAVIDIADPWHPAVVAVRDTPGEVIHLELSGDHVYVVDSVAGLLVFDISTPTDPQQVGALETTGQTAGFAVSDGYAYIAEGWLGVDVVDVADPTDPQLVGNIDTALGSMDVAVSGNRAYVSETDGAYSRLQVVEISDPLNPVLEGNTAGMSAPRKVVVSGNHVFVLDINEGVHLVDISDPGDPVIVGLLGIINSGWGLAISGDYAFVAGRLPDGFQIFDISHPVAAEQVGSMATNHWLTHVTVHGDYAYAAGYDKGGLHSLLLIDVTDPANPQSAGWLDTAGEDHGVAFSGDYAYVAGGAAGLQVVDVSDPLNSQLVLSVATSDDAVDVALSGPFAYVLKSTGLQVFFFTDPAASPMDLGGTPLFGSCKSIHLSGDYAYVANGYDGLRVLDVSSPCCPVLIGTLDTPGRVEDVAVLDDQVAYVADSHGGLLICSLSDHTNPLPINTIATPGEAVAVEISGNRAFVACRDAGVLVFDVSTTEPLVPLGIIGTQSAAQWVAVTEDGVFAACVGGLEVMSPYCEDCNGNGIDDQVEIAARPSIDFNNDGIIDACQQGQGISGVPVVTGNGFALLEPRPNPFNPRTRIAFELPGQTAVHLQVFDLSGRLVKRLIDGEIFGPGSHEAVWNGCDDSGRRVASGIYFCRLEVGRHREIRRMALIK